MSANLDFEFNFIKGLLGKSTRKRWRALFTSQNGRKRFLKKLYHDYMFDDKYTIELTPSNLMPDDIYDLLQNYGAPDTCYIIANNVDMDTKTLNLRECLHYIQGNFSEGWILCCVPGSLLYYIGEAPYNRFIVYKDTD
ncbi:MAG: hypothetical protein H0T84_13990 [Tatlockia sp.]|nr:hypothetical protein [Tatlockia sp.]